MHPANVTHATASQSSPSTNESPRVGPWVSQRTYCVVHVQPYTLDCPLATVLRVGCLEGTGNASLSRWRELSRCRVCAAWTPRSAPAAFPPHQPRPLPPHTTRHWMFWLCLTHGWQGTPLVQSVCGRAGSRTNRLLGRSFYVTIYVTNRPSARFHRGCCSCSCSRHGWWCWCGCGVRQSPPTRWCTASVLLKDLVCCRVAPTLLSVSALWVTGVGSTRGHSAGVNGERVVPTPQVNARTPTWCGAGCIVCGACSGGACLVCG